MANKSVELGRKALTKLLEDIRQLYAEDPSPEEIMAWLYGYQAASGADWHQMMSAINDSTTRRMWSYELELVADALIRYDEPEVSKPVKRR